LILEIVLLAFAVALIRKGSIRALIDLKVSCLWLALAAPVVIFALTIARHHGYEPTVLKISGPLHVVTTITWIAFFWINRRIGGMLLMALGSFINLWPIAFNGGMMPISVPSLKAAHISQRHEDATLNRPMARHCLMSDKTRLKWLADWIPIPRPPFYIAPTVVSPGDLFCTAGMALFLQSAMGVSRRKWKKQ
jgi:hypothetical protein